MNDKNVFKYLKLVLSLLLVCALMDLAHAQVNQDYSNIKVDQLTDTQVRQIQAQIRAAGIPESQLEQAAIARGMSATEVQKLRTRLASLKDASGTPANQQPQNSGRQTIPGITEPDSLKDVSAISVSRVFGASLFNNRNITFEPNLRIATPKNYVIGPDDQILIDITGDNEANYKLTVSPEGSIRVEYAGIIAVSGLTVEDATARIRSRLIQTYPGISSGRTRLTVSIGDIRSIRVTLIGEVTVPGTYTLSSLATVFTALYSAGGPNPNGSFREIQLIRNNRVISTLDAYDYIIKGYQANNFRLQDQDVIRIPVYKVHADLSGEVKHSAIFEVLPRETFADVLRFASGFTDRAYTASVKVVSNTAREKQVSDIPAASFATYIPKNGDRFTVDSILNRYLNRVTIKGAVFRPGQFSIEPGLTLSGLIAKADGVKEDAFLSRGTIQRLKPDNTSEVLSFNPEEVINKSAPDVILQREDIVNIFSIFDLRDEYRISINGEVRQAGTYRFGEGMTIQDLILLAGGFTEGASAKTIEIGRRTKNGESDSYTSKTADIQYVSVDQNLSIQGPKVILQPFDIVTVRNNTAFSEQRQVTVEGEVLHPGSFVIATKDERISDLVKRSGGLTPNAYPDGASLKRDLKAIGTGKNKLDLTEEILVREKNKARLQEDVGADSSERNSMEIINNSTIGIDLTKILANPGREDDLILREGDVLRIPQLLQTVKINGEVLYPVTAVYKSGRGYQYYISQGGGYTQKALGKNSYVIYANGLVTSTKKFLFFKIYPEIRPGAEIFVPLKADKKPVSATEIVAISTGLASLGAIILGILNLNSN